MAGPGDRKPGEGLGDVGTSMRAAQPFIDAAWQFVASVGLLTLLGYWADKRFGTKPWLLVTGSVLGFFVGTWSFVKLVLVLDKKSKAQRAGGTPPGEEGKERK